ncbi:MAG: hypothetical protein WC661_09470 [Opitutaceae bacterium]
MKITLVGGGAHRLLGILRGAPAVPGARGSDGPDVAQDARATPRGRPRLPGTFPGGVAHGLSASLAAHQTMLGEALVTKDPVLLVRALPAYPEKPYSKAARSLYRELFAIGDSGITAPYRAATGHF